MTASKSLAWNRGPLLLLLLLLVSVQGSPAPRPTLPATRRLSEGRYAPGLARKVQGWREGVEPLPLPQPCVVQLMPDVDAPSLTALLEELEGRSEGPAHPHFGAHVVRRVSPHHLVMDLTEDAHAYLTGHPLVELVELDVMLRAEVVPDDVTPPGLTSSSLLEGMPFLPSEGGVAQFDAPISLDRVDQRRLPLDATFRFTGNGGGGVDVYIMDSGVRASHVEFAGRVEPGANFSPDQAPGEVHDCAGHGTHVASLAVGATFGVAKGATLIPVRVYDCDNAGPLSQALEGIEWVLTSITDRKRKAVVNMSFGGPVSTILNRAVTKLTEAGALVVSAAGNDAVDSCSISPASARDSLTVGATNEDDTWAPYSNHGRCVDVTAPGTRIPGASQDNDRGVMLMSGSSMAAPLVAGSAALFFAGQPHAGPREAKRALLCSATPNVVREAPPNTKDLMIYNPPGGWRDVAGGCSVGGAGGAAPLVLLPGTALAVLLLSALRAAVGGGA